MRSVYGCPLRGSGVVREVGRAFQARLWKSNRIHLASSDHTAVLWSKLCVNFKKRGDMGISSEPRPRGPDVLCLSGKDHPAAAHSAFQFR